MEQKTNYASLFNTPGLYGLKVNPLVSQASRLVSQIEAVFPTAQDMTSVSFCSMKDLQKKTKTLQDFLETAKKEEQEFSEWYPQQREQLMNLISDTEAAFRAYMVEVQNYWTLVMSHLVRGSKLNVIQAELKQKMNQCYQINSHNENYATSSRTTSLFRSPRSNMVNLSSLWN